MRIVPLLSVVVVSLLAPVSLAGADPSAVLRSDTLAASVNSHTGALESIENRLTGDVYAISGDEFCVEASAWRVDFSDMKLVALTLQPGKVEARYEHPRLLVEVTYTLGDGRHFLEKQLWLSCSEDCGLTQVTVSRPEFVADHLQMVAWRYPDFEPVTAMIQAKHGWELHRPPGTEPIRTYFGRTEKGGLFAGLELPFDTSSAEGNRLVLSYAPSLRVRAGERLACEPMYLGVYQRHARDLRAEEWRPAVVAQPATMPLPSESEAMEAMTAAILGPPRHGLVALACGWHCQMQQDAYDSDEELASDLQSLEFIKACGLDGLTDCHPWGGETAKMNALGAEDRYALDPRVRRFVERASQLGLMVTQWPTMNNTHPWNNAGQPFRSDRPEWLRGVEGPGVDGVNADNFRQRRANCFACTPFYDWLTGIVSEAMAEGRYASWCMDGDFWGTGAYFHTTLPVTCLATNHDHLPGDANYACQRNLAQLIAHVRRQHPQTYILMCRPAQDLGVWSQRNVDACFTLIESGTGVSNVAAGDEIRTASRIRVHHHFLPHWLDQSLLFPSYADPSLKSVPTWPSEKLDYILLSAMSCSPNLLMYLPTKTGIPDQDKAEIHKWLEWGRANVQYLMVRRDLFDWPAPGKLDGSAHFVGDRGLIFLFNPSPQVQSASVELTVDELGVGGTGSCRVWQEYPSGGDALTVEHGQTISWQVPPATALVLRVERAQVP
jgi:hypothetical protein